MARLVSAGTYKRKGGALPGSRPLHRALRWAGPGTRALELCLSTRGDRWRPGPGSAPSPSPELPYEDVFAVWEVIWAARHISSEHFVLFIALALVEAYREIIRDNNMDFTDIIKFFNGRSHSALPAAPAGLLAGVGGGEPLRLVWAG